MSIQSNKLMNLADGKLLYDDLRQRLASHTADTATLEEIQMIIDNYGDEEDEGMIVETTWYVNTNQQYDAGFVSEMDADDIVAAFKAGKNIIVHFPRTEGYGSSSTYGCGGDTYASFVAFEDAYVDNQTNNSAQFGVSSTCIGNIGATRMISSVTKNNDGKLYFAIYVD